MRRQAEDFQADVAGAQAADKACSDEEVALDAGGEGQQGEVARCLLAQVALAEREGEGHGAPVEGDAAQRKNAAVLGEEAGGCGQAEELSLAQRETPCRPGSASKSEGIAWSRSAARATQKSTASQPSLRPTNTVVMPNAPAVGAGVK